MSKNILEQLVDAQSLKVVPQGISGPSIESTNQVKNDEASVGNKLRNSLDNIIKNHKPKVYGVISTMILAGVALSIGGNILNPNEPITLSKEATSITSPSNQVASASLFNSITNKIKSASTIESPSFPILKTQSGRFSIDSDLKSSLEDAAKFSIPDGLKENQISRHVSQIKFKSAMEKSTVQDFLASLMSEGEGFRSNLYRDNIGLAYGIGWNVSMQSKDFNTFLMGAVNDNPEAIKQITSFSSSPIAYPAGKYGTDETKMPVQRHLQASLIIADTFKNEGVLKGLEKHIRNVPLAKSTFKNEGVDYKTQTAKAFKSLDPNIQASLIYHSYKVGSAGYGKYNTLNQRVAEYALTPIEKRTAEQRRSIAETISYSYKYNGETLRDTRAEIKVAAMISNPEAFGSMIKSNPAPKTIYEDVPQLKANKVTVPTGNEEYSIPDPVGTLKQSSLESGKPLDLKLQFNYGDLNIQKPSPKPTVRKTGAAHFW